MENGSVSTVGQGSSFLKPNQTPTRAYKNNLAQYNENATTLYQATKKVHSSRQHSNRRAASDDDEKTRCIIDRNNSNFVNEESKDD